MLSDVDTLNTFKLREIVFKVLTHTMCEIDKESITGLILGLHPTNERRRYKVTPSLIDCTSKAPYLQFKSRWYS